MSDQFIDETYNPSGDLVFDNKDYRQPRSDADADGLVPIARSQNAGPGAHAQREDAAAKESERTGRIDKREVQDLVSDMRDDERDLRGGTRGNRVDAYQQERTVDQQVDLALDEDQGML